jgi:tetratricopeptide (TPR) repeat protein
MAHQSSPARRRNAIALAAACVALIVCPGAAYGQKAAFVEAFVTFHSRLIGTYGDEGPQIAAALDEMAVGLVAWDREAAAAEAALRASQSVAPADLAVLHLDRSRFEDALKEMDAAIRAEPRRAAFHRLRGLIHEAAGRPADAVAALATAWQLDPDDPITAYLLADRRTAASPGEDIQPQVATLLAAYGRAGGPTFGRSRAPFFQLSLIQDRAADTPIFSPVLYADGLRLIAQGRYQDAVVRFRDAMTRDPLIVDPAARSAQMARGIAALREGRLADAIESLETAVEATPGSSEAHRILGAAYQAAGNGPRSVEQLNTAVRLAPADERARVGLGRALIDAGRHDEAERALRETIAALPASAEARWALADLFEKAGRGLDAISELEAAAELNVLAGKYQLWWRIAELAHRHQDYERVALVLARRARLMPNEAGAHKDAGLAYTRLGRPNEALLELLMTALLGLEDAETLAAIGQMHLDAGRLADAEAVLRRAVALQPDRAQARYALGTALVRLGKTEEGREHLTEFQRLRTAALEEQQRTAQPGTGGAGALAPEKTQ